MFRLFPLLVYNTLTRTKVRFVPRTPGQVTWYQCGPTVYAESHLGHARTYVSLDIIRKILRDYFGYNVVVCQNITDIDDKIIIRSAERNENFRSLASKYEIEFLEDMKTLGVELPEMLTRVSEYIDEIIEFIDSLVKKGLAYESDGSVYFDVNAFVAAGFTYGKLAPEQVGNSDLLQEGEGALSSNSVKRSPADFALWKKTKDLEKEPGWSSPWGLGRPGWHIECSVMCTSAFKTIGSDKIDIHAGGVDLKFPHHDNEIAQSEAYLNCHDWVNYWLHTGHLNIEGAKMSKSLKNFKTIRDALQVYTPRQFRVCYLLHKYNAPMDYSEGTLAEAVNVDKMFSEFFLNVKAKLRDMGSIGEKNQHVGPTEQQLLQKLEAAKSNIHRCLCDDFDTPGVVQVLIELIHDCNKIMTDKGLSIVILRMVAKTITNYLRPFGLIPNSTEIGFPLDSSSTGNKEETVAPILDAFIDFRQAVRNAAFAALKSNDPTLDVKSMSSLLLEEADKVRDNSLPSLGVRVEDESAVKSIWKLEDPEVLKKEQALKEAAENLKKQQREEALRRVKEKEERSKIPPSEMFLTQTDLYSKFDEQGLPTHDAKGEPLSKGTTKKLAKEHAKQTELYQKFLESQSK